MPRKLLQRYLPSRDDLSRPNRLGMFGSRIADPELWHLNRRSVSSALGVGLFLAFLPIPGQMFLAAVAAIWFRFNLPVAFLSVWVTNPVTMPPIYLFAYTVGTWCLDMPPRVEELDLSWSWLAERIEHIWAPMLVGCLVCGVISGALAWGGMQLFWRWHVVQRWERRRTLRRLRGA
ncbi:MAG: DUF2062 domain-containing protein [Pseudomonadales bacterium]|jgi:uncharacterized protein (DUF2062 family)|nr:DUF2062 domain-containing protein [Pseudomonadales bacterium]